MRLSFGMLSSCSVVAVFGIDIFLINSVIIYEQPQQLLKIHAL